MSNRFVALLLPLLAFAPLARAGQGTFTGEESEDFGKGGFSVILAKFGGAREYPKGASPDFTHHATLVPLATLSGGFDPGLHPTLEVGFNCGPVFTNTSIQTVPKEGAMVLAVIRHGILIGDVKVPRNAVVSHVCTFMPRHSALVEVSGADDAQVRETLQRIQAARARGVAKPKERG